MMRRGQALVEDRNMLLPDGRCLMDSEAAARNTDATRVAVPIHKDFRVIVLANKPGFPFLGNDFYRECGDLFAGTNSFSARLATAII